MLTEEDSIDIRRGLILRSKNEYQRSSPDTPETPTAPIPSTSAYKSPAVVLSEIEATNGRIEEICDALTRISSRGLSSKLAKETRSFKEDIRAFKRGTLFTEAKMHNSALEQSSTNTTFTSESTTMVIDNILKVLPVFTGEPVGQAETNLQIFLNVAQAYYRTLAPPDQITFLSLVPKLRLRGVPYEICNGKSFGTFEELQKVLSDYFFQPKDLSALTHELQSCRQLNGETVRQFGQRILTKLNECDMYLGQLCKDNAEPVLEEYMRIAIQTFRRGLLSFSLKQYACIQENKTLTDLIKKVSEMELLENQCFTGHNLVTQSTWDPRTISGQIMQVEPQAQNSQIYFSENLRSSPFVGSSPPIANTGGNSRGPSLREQWRTPPQGEPRDRSRKPLTCFRCGQQGHISRECRSPRRFCQQCKSTGHDARDCPRSRRQEVRRIEKQAICDFCQRYGHWMEECAAKAKWEARNANGRNQGNDQAPVADSNGRQ